MIIRSKTATLSLSFPKSGEDKKLLMTINFSAFLFARLALRKKEIDCVNVDRELCNGDRIALLPPGTPGSYRLILGTKAMNDEGDTSG